MGEWSAHVESGRGRAAQRLRRLPDEAWIRGIGFVPYPGALNLRVESRKVRTQIMRSGRTIELRDRTDAALAYRLTGPFWVAANTIAWAVWTRDPAVIQVVSPVDLRRSLHLEDDSAVVITDR